MMTAVVAVVAVVALVIFVVVVVAAELSSKFISLRKILETFVFNYSEWKIDRLFFNKMK